jgi:hypothetical protein
MSDPVILPRWILDVRLEAEKLAQLCELSCHAEPADFAQREDRILRTLLARARKLVRHLEWAAGVHDAVPTDETVILIDERRRRRALFRVLSAETDTPPAA